MARRKIHGITFDSPDEVEVFHAKESWVPLVLGTLPYILVGVVAAVCLSLFGLVVPGTIILVVACVLALITRIPKIIANLDTDVVVSNKRLYARTGIFDIKDQVTDLTNVSDVTVDPSLLGRMFDYADVTIQTFAGESDFELKHISHAYDMRAAISRGADSARNHYHGPEPRRNQRR